MTASKVEADVCHALADYRELFKVGAGLNPTVLLALIFISSPVCGFLPFLAFRFLTVNVPKAG